MAERILMNEFKTLSKEKWVNIELDHEDIFKWKVALMVLNPDSLYHGGYFMAKMSFPANYPYSPPEFRFNRPLFHPNIYPDGRLCISILHTPGEDEMSGELAAERWSPAQRVESVLLSIVSLLDDAECSSPANVDAGVLLRNKPEEYKRRVQADVETSKNDIPLGFVVPEREIAVKQEKGPVENDDFWYDSDQEFDFGGSDTDEEENEDADEEMTQDAYAVEDEEEDDDSEEDCDKMVD